MPDDLRKLVALIRNALSIRPELFDESITRERAEKLFREYVEIVEWETDSFCNRVCGFCPNSFLDRRSRRPMKEDVWDAVVPVLSRLGYGGSFVWSRYSEPLADPLIHEKIATVRLALPKAQLVVISNTDYLDADFFGRLADVGLDRLVLDIYLKSGEVFGKEAVYSAVTALCGKLKGSHQLVRSDAANYTFRILGPGSSRMRVTAGCSDFSNRNPDLSFDRGGLLESLAPPGFERRAPCFAPTKHVAVDGNGSVMPCCHMRSDAPSHQNSVIGILGKNWDIVDAYRSLARWRSQLSGYDRKTGPCRHCTVSDYTGGRLRKMFYQSVASLMKSPLPESFRSLLRKSAGSRRKRFNP